MNKIGSHPREVFLKSSHISHATLDNGAARRLNEKYIVHLYEKQISSPNMINQDPLMVSVIPEADKPWTTDLELLTQKLDADELFDDFNVRVWGHQHLFA